MQNLQRGIANLEHVSSSEAQTSLQEGLDYDALAQSGIARRHETIALSDFEDYLEQADYEGVYPEYIEQFAKAYKNAGRDASLVNRKFFEQFLSIHLTRPGKDDVVCDIAAAKGTFSGIVKRLCGVKTSYHQDISKPNLQTCPYLDNDEIVPVQGNAAALPFGDGEIDYMYLLNSWEHFQAPTDLEYLKEAERCLAPGGQSIIVPLNGAARAIVRTNPDLWDKKQVYDKNEQPWFRKDVAIKCDTAGQVYAQDHDARLLVEFATLTPGLTHEIVTVSLDTDVSWYANKPWDVLISTRKG